MRSFHARVQIEPLEDGGYLVDCPAIQGCYAEGKTVGDALDHLRDVARVIYELCQEKGLVFVTDHPDITFNSARRRHIWLLYSMEIENGNYTTDR